VLENNNTSELIPEQELKAALEENTKWRGSKEQMWAEIEAKLDPIPWYKQRRSWMAAAAAAMLFIMVLFNQGTVPPQELPTDLEMRSSLKSAEQPESMQMFTIMSAFEPQPNSRVNIEIDMADTAAAGSEITLNLRLTITAETEFAVEKPSATVMRTDDHGLVTIISEIPIEDWNNKSADSQNPLFGTLMLTAPAEPGSYLVEISVPGKIDGQLFFFSETKSFSVVKN